MMFGFDPGQSLLRIGPESLPGLLPGPSAMTRYTRFENEGLGPEMQRVDLASILGNSQKLKGLPGKIPTNGQVTYELSAEEHLLWLLVTQEAFSTTEVVPGVHQLRMAPSEATPAPASLAVEKWMDDGNALIMGGVRPSSTQITVSPGGVAKMVINAVAEHATHWGDAVGTSAPAPTVFPALRGMPAHATWDLADGDPHIQVTDVSGLPQRFEVVAKVGAATPYGGIASTINVGADDRGDPYWSELLDSTTGGRLQAATTPAELALEDATGLVVGAEWRFDRDRGAWVPVWPDVLPFNEIFASVVIDGEKIQVDQVQITITPPVTAKPRVGSQWTRPRRRGTRGVAVTFQKEYLDTGLYRRLISGASFGLVLDMTTGTPFEGIHEHELSIVTPNLVGAGKGPAVANAEEITESINATAHPDPGNAQGFVDDVTVMVQSSIEDPLA